MFKGLKGFIQHKVQHHNTTSASKGVGPILPPSREGPIPYKYATIGGTAAPHAPALTADGSRGEEAATPPEEDRLQVGLPSAVGK